jgi:hypothetical protein
MVLCVDTPDDFPSKLAQSMTQEREPLDLSDPFTLHLPLVDRIIHLYDESVWGIRDLIRRVEKVSSLSPQTNKAEIADYLSCRAER